MFRSIQYPIRPALRPFLAAVLLWISCGSVPAASTADLYMKNCAVCHLPGIAGAPQVGDKVDWSRRVRPGMTLLYRSAVEGIPNTAMTAKGGHADLTDPEIRAIVDYMLAATALDRDVLAAAARYDKLGITDREFIALDADYDGFLSRAEIASDAMLLVNLKRFDRDRDGKLSAAEYRMAETTLERERASVEIPDDTLSAAVRAALSKVTGVDMANTRIEADRGVIAVIGMVENAEVARRAYSVLKRVNGVKKIDNRLVSAQQLTFD